MLTLNYVFCFSCFRESIITKFTKTLHQKIVSFSHFLNPGSKLYSNLKYISSFFCEFFFTAMYKIIENKFKTSISYPYKSPFYRSRSLKSVRSTNSGEPAAVVGFRNQIKVEAFHLPKSAAAGLLGGLVREVCKVIGVGWNDDESMQGYLEGWGNGGMGDWEKIEFNKVRRVEEMALNIFGQARKPAPTCRGDSLWSPVSYDIIFLALLITGLCQNRRARGKVWAAESTKVWFYPPAKITCRGLAFFLAIRI